MAGFKKKSQSQYFANGNTVEIGGNCVCVCMYIIKYRLKRPGVSHSVGICNLANFKPILFISKSKEKNSCQN